MAAAALGILNHNGLQVLSDEEKRKRYAVAPESIWELSKGGFNDRIERLLERQYEKLTFYIEKPFCFEVESENCEETNET